MRTLQILNFVGNVICEVKLDFHRWEIEGGWLKVYDFSDTLVFKHTLNHNEYSWRTE